MMHTPITLTSTWTQVVTGASTLLVQSTVEAELYVGTGPTASDIGFDIKADLPHLVPDLSALGGEVWARGTGVLIYASDV